MRRFCGNIAFIAKTPTCFAAHYTVSKSGIRSCWSQSSRSSVKIPPCSTSRVTHLRFLAVLSLVIYRPIGYLRYCGRGFVRYSLIGYWLTVSSADLFLVLDTNQPRNSEIMQRCFLISASNAWTVSNGRLHDGTHDASLSWQRQRAGHVYHQWHVVQRLFAV